MASRDVRRAVLIGVGQRIQRDVDPRDALDPIGLMESACRLAAEDAQATLASLRGVDRVAVPGILGSRYSNAARLLAERLEVTRATPLYTRVGGNTPQRLINGFAREIATGRSDFVLLAGSEALHTQRLARREGLRLDWSGGGDPGPVEEEPAPSNDLELRYGIELPISVYPIYENALRARSGLGLEAHRKRVGALLERFTETAAENPYAWLPIRRSADEITLPGSGNRMVYFPYTKYMNAFMNVDQSAAVLLCSEERARSLGTPESKWVYWLGGGDAWEDPWPISERRDFHSSPAMARAFRDALGEAGLEVEQVGAFDLYSCFPSAVQMACQSLGIPIDDPRPLSVTGGLPYAGGPGNNYSTHAVARMVERLRERPGEVGMVTGIGWYFSKHSAGVYGARSPTWAGYTPEPAARGSAVPLVRIPSDADAARARIETYTISHDRDGAAARGIAVVRVDDGRRTLARIDAGADALVELEREELVGRTGVLRVDRERLRLGFDG